MIDPDNVEWSVDDIHNRDFVIHRADVGVFSLRIWEDSVTINPRIYITTEFPNFKYVEVFNEQSDSLKDAKARCVEYVNYVLNSVRR
jgi:hypothetical protein